MYAIRYKIRVHAYTHMLRDYVGITKRIHCLITACTIQITNNKQQTRVVTVCARMVVCNFYDFMLHQRESIESINLLINDLNKFEEMLRIFMMSSNNSGNGFVCIILQMAYEYVVISFISCGHLNLECVHLHNDTSAQDDQTQIHKPCK